MNLLNVALRLPVPLNATALTGTRSACLLVRIRRYRAAGHKRNVERVKP